MFVKENVQQINILISVKDDVQQINILAISVKDDVQQNASLCIFPFTSLLISLGAYVFSISLF
jgi:hypothetical protein